MLGDTGEDNPLFSANRVPWGAESSTVVSQNKVYSNFIYLSVCDFSVERNYGSSFILQLVAFSDYYLQPRLASSLCGDGIMVYLCLR